MGIQLINQIEFQWSENIVYFKNVLFTSEVLKICWRKAVLWSGLFTEFLQYTNVQGTSVASQMLYILFVKYKSWYTKHAEVMTGEKKMYFLELSHDRCLDNQTIISFLNERGLCTEVKSVKSLIPYFIILSQFLTFMFMKRAKYAVFVIFNNFAHMCDPRYVV